MYNQTGIFYLLLNIQASWNFKRLRFKMQFWGRGHSGSTHLLGYYCSAQAIFFCKGGVAMGTAGGQLVKGVGLLNWSDLLQLFSFKESAFLSCEKLKHWEWRPWEVSLKGRNTRLICFHPGEEKALSPASSQSHRNGSAFFLLLLGSL